MADKEGRIEFPDEVDEIKAAAADAEDKNKGGDSNSVKEVPPGTIITPLNMIVAPANCPEGFERGTDGICREVFK